MDAISVKGLVKRFGRHTALDDLDLAVEVGQVHGFLGPNGAGKTTTLRILLGLLDQDGGAASVLGMDPWRDAAALHRRLAYVPGEVSLWPNLTGGEVIDLLGSLRGGLDRARRAELIERFQLDPTKKCRAYSKGNRQKVALVSAFASGAELYLLDEPTSGLDPLMMAVFQDVVHEAHDAGGTVLLSSHILSEVEALCDHVTIVRGGRTADSGTFEELRHLTRTTVVVETAEPPYGLAGLPGVHDARIEHTRAEFSVDHADLNRVLGHLVGLGVRALTTSPPTLEELFLRHYEDASARDADGGLDLVPSRPDDVQPTSDPTECASDLATSTSDLAESSLDDAPSTSDLELVR
ncbi:MAG: ABC transporter ATP-binding protein [Thermoleophilia bacterium]|jgi:ABC-2 type transport system ATP-binding protein|nr:ABC transporter ATP-binding protein [Thermoleophilia bacterium]